MCSRLREKSMNQTTDLPAFLIRTTLPCINDIILSQLNSLALFFQLTLNIHKYSNCRNGAMMVKERGNSFFSMEEKESNWKNCTDTLLDIEFLIKLYMFSQRWALSIIKFYSKKNLSINLILVSLKSH